MAIFRNTITGNEMELHTQPDDFFIMSCQKWERVNNQSALASQVGGSHYKDYRIQPVQFFHDNNVPFIEASVCKYVLRWREKNGIEDLKKARHYLDILIEMEEKK